MRIAIAVIVAVIGAYAVQAQPKPEPQPRYGVVAETNIYPQESPKQALASLAKAFDRQRVDYVLAHLADPTFTAGKVAQFYRQKFGRVPEDDLELSEGERDRRLKTAVALFAAEVSDHMDSFPKQTLRFFRLLKNGAVAEAGTTATVTLADTPEVTLTLKQLEGRWYMVNDPEAAKPRAEGDKPKVDADKPKN